MKYIKRSALTLSILAILSAPLHVNANENNYHGDALDAWIDGKVEATLLFNESLSAFNINADVMGGIVTLTGGVNYSTDRQLAEELTLGIKGVSKVTNKLFVRTQMGESASVASEVTDAKIAAVVKSRLIFEPEISAMDIDVEVAQGTVTLKGSVASDAVRELAVSIARNTTDVNDVTDMLEIEKLGG
jgi:osmotically-inducible protein OsmY